MPAISGSDKSLLYAMCGVARCGATRCNDISALPFVMIDGTLRASDADGKIGYDAGISVSESAGQNGNTATMTGFKFDPPEMAEVIVTLGSINNCDPVFAGRLTRKGPTTQTNKNALVFTDITAVDYTIDANKRLINKRYQSMAADLIVADLITNFASGFSPVGIVSGLPTIDEITFTNESFTGALSRIADRIGGYATISYVKSDGNPIVRLYLTPTGTNPSELNDTHPTLKNFKYTADWSSVKTRVYVEGNGSTALADVAVGDTILPLLDATYPNASGGAVVSGPQRITYAAVAEGGGGSLVGPGASPAAAPALALAAGAGVNDGAHSYAVTFVTGAGESLPSPLASITTGTFTTAAPSVAPTFYNSSSGSLGTGLYYWAVTFVTAGGETTASGTFAYYAAAGMSLELTIPVGPSPVTNRRIYRTTAGGSQLKLVAAVGNNTATTYSDGLADGSLGANVPTSNTASDALNQVSLSGIPIGGASVTSRKVYRTVAAGSQLKLQSTIADNVTTTATDSTADGSLGANVPTSDTSGLTQPEGQISAGATSMIVAGTGAFSSSGGWAIAAGQPIRYSSISGTSLAGIPATGTGSIGASISYNTTITAAPMLTGIPSSGDGSIAEAITKGDAVNICVQVDDVPAQVALAALVGGDDDGIREEALQDRRLSFTEATARGTAFLALRSTAQLTVTYDCGDINSKVGREVAVDISPISDTFKIQSVRVDTFTSTGSRATDPLGVDIFPCFHVTASNQRYSLEDLLRQLKGKA